MTEQEITKHKIAAKKLWLVNQKTFQFIKKNINKISEYDVFKFIISEFKKQEMITDENYPIQIVALNENAAIPHYFPSKKNSKIIKQNNLILLDTWAKLKEKRAPFADITWIVYSGKNPPKEIRETFDKVIRARNLALKLIRENLKRKKLPKTKTIEKEVRDYFKKFGLEKNFVHGLGHSLGFSQCHGKYFRFGKKSEARIKPNIPFTIEPGLYFKNRFGIRSEINCYVTKDYKLVITSKVQNKIVKI